MTINRPGADGTGLDLELRSLAQSLAIPEPADRTVEAVMARLDRAPVPAAPNWWRRVGATAEAMRGWLQNRWRTVCVALAALLVVLLAVTPAGAKVREWLGFGAVVIEQQQPAQTAGSTATSAISSSSGVSPPARELSLNQAMAESSFPIGVPVALGEPDVVTASTDGRVVSMQWTTSGVRLDQIDGALAPYFAKTYFQDVEFTEVNGAEALWLARPHPIMVLNPDGSEHVESARQSGPSLIWQVGDVTLRLEGVAELSAAVTIAESLPN